MVQNQQNAGKFHRMIRSHHEVHVLNFEKLAEIAMLLMGLAQKHPMLSDFHRHGVVNAPGNSPHQGTIEVTTSSGRGSALTIEVHAAVV
jgi:hypothetical protein